MDNISKTLDLIQYGKTKCIGPSLLLLIDIEKAFDQVEMRYFSILEHMEVGPVFQRALQSIYDRPTAMVCFIGASSASFCISRGTR